MMVHSIVCALLLVFTVSNVDVAAVEVAPNVAVEFYFESLCPYCQTFTTGPLKRVLDKPDMVEIINLKLVSYGNTKRAADGSFSCQHGVNECKSDVLELCTLYKLSNDVNSISTGDTSLAAWPFILCMEEANGDPSKGESCYTSTMDTKALPWSTVATCAKEEESLVQTTAMKATPIHDYVPWVLVDGTLLENTNLLQKAICDAYTGQPPASCKLLEPVEKSSTNSTVCLFSDK